jgi:hypothetical protein
MTSLELQPSGTVFLLKITITLPLVSVMRVIKRNIEKVWSARYTLGARYLYIIRNAEKVCGARYTLGARYLPKNTVFNALFRMQII